MLLQKLIEELEEFKEKPIEEELAYILEVIEGIATVFDFDMKENKKIERGGFENRFI